MAIVPIFACGWENGLLEGNAQAPYDSLPVVSDAKAYTGNYSLRFTNGSSAYGRSVPPLTNLQAAAMFNHNGLSVSPQAIFFRLVDALGVVYTIQWEGATITWRRDATILASAASTPISVVDHWHDLSVAVRAGSWLEFYAEGNLVLSGGAPNSDPIVAVMVGGRRTASNNSWGNYLYVDDFRVNDATGETEPSPASTRRFLWAGVDGNGQVNEWTNSDGNSTNNYQYVDDGVTPDGDTTFVRANVDSLVDQYTHSGVTVPTDWSPVRVWPTMIGRKTDAAIDTTVQVGLWKNSDDVDSAELSLSTSYGMVQAALETLPDGAAMTEANINDCELRLVSAGDYS